MNLQEFEDAVVEGDLSDKGTLDKWQKFCKILSELDVEIVKEIIHEDGLSMFKEFESLDYFGTEGVKL